MSKNFLACLFCLGMEGGLVLLGGSGGSGSSGVSTNESAVSKAEVVVSEANSYPAESELELGLGLSLGSLTGKTTNKGAGASSSWGEYGRNKILTTKDFPSHRANNNGGSGPSPVAVSGTKRAAAEPVSHDHGGSPTAVRFVSSLNTINACLCKVADKMFERNANLFVSGTVKLDMKLNFILFSLSLFFSSIICLLLALYFSRLF